MGQNDQMKLQSLRHEYMGETRLMSGTTDGKVSHDSTKSRFQKNHNF